MPLSEQQLIAWSRPASTTEDQKCKNAVSQITEAIRSKFGNSVTIFLQGSYQNNTNVRQDSDVDIVVRHHYYYPDLVRLTTDQQVTFYATWVSGNYTFEQLKSDTYQALHTAFGVDAQRRNKCVKVAGNSNRVNIDVVPCFVLRRYKNLTDIEADGIKFYTDIGSFEIISFPEQHYVNGVAKRAATGHMYKKIVRILKRIRNELIDSNLISKDLVSSFFIECIIYNVPNDNFISGNYLGTLRNILIRIYNDMLNLEVANKYVEVSELKWLFSGTRTPEHAKQFTQKCWEYAEFK